MDKQELQKSAEAKSDQIDADDMIGNITMDVTIEAVKRGTSEQPIQLVLKETEKFYRPNKTFRRALIGCFGDEPANWVGQRLRLARDPNVMWGGVKVGGVIVSHASIEAPMVFMLQAKRGKKSAVSIDVIPPIQKPVPMPAKVKEAAAKLHAKGTISGDPNEGDLTGIGEPPPAADKPDGATLGQVINAFATKLSMTAPMIEAEYNKPMAEWTNADVAEARELFKHLLAERNAMAGDGGEV